MINCHFFSAYPNYSMNTYILTSKITSKIIHVNGLYFRTEPLHVVIPQIFDAKTFKDLSSKNQEIQVKIRCTELDPKALQSQFGYVTNAGKLIISS